MAKGKSGTPSSMQGNKTGGSGSGRPVTPRSSARPTPARPSGSRPTGRQSVAAARRTKPGSDRNQLIGYGVAVLVLIVIVVVGVIVYKNKTAVQNNGYGASTNSVSSVSGGIVTVNNGTTPKVTIDVYQDALCPSCQLFEHQYGQQINQAVDEGKLAVRYHMVTFLNASSASKTYSTRAAAALLCVGADSAAPKGTFLKYLTHLYADDTKPAEQGSTDLSNQQLADLAKGDGATTTAQTCISSGSNVSLVTATDKTNEAEMQTATGSVQTPTVLNGGQAVDIDPTDWLTKLIA